MNHKKHFSKIAFLLLLSIQLFAQNGLYPKNPAWLNLPLNNWQGVSQTDEILNFSTSGKAIFTVPEGTKGWYQRGLMQEHDGVIDARYWHGLQIDIYVEKESLFETQITIHIPKQDNRHNLPDSTTANLKVQGKGWHTLTVPFSAFNYNRGQAFFLKYVKKITFKGQYIQEKSDAKIRFRNVKLIKGNPLYFDATVVSKAGTADSAVHYTALIGNSSDKTQIVNLSFIKKGWEGMSARVEPSFITLQAGEEKRVDVYVNIPEIAPQGSQETQTLVAATSNGITSSIDFITVKKLEGSFLVHQEAGWKEVIEKTQKYEWAKKEATEYIRKADEFQVPETPVGNIKGEGSMAVYQSYLEQRFWPVAIAYKLTGEKKYAEKLALLLRRLSAPTAYPTTLHANSQGIPQEGGFWEGIARSYDLIKDSGVLSSADKHLIENSLRLFIYTIEESMGDGGISNWSVFNLCPAAQCALVLQDFYHFNYLMNNTGGIKDHVRYGTMDDGWWYEVSLSYNVGCVENMTALALAAKPFGIDFLNEKIPVALTQNVGLRPFEYENFQGMAFGKFGPIKRNYVTLKDMWDAITIYPDYRGIMFGMGDGHEQKVGSGPFEIAYFAFRDINYAAVIKQSEHRDLLYGIPDLPANTPKLYTLSTHSDNAGVSVLRSQKEGREQKEQIQVAMKYGTHGSYHGHFDRASLLSLMRYGRSFWNPETSWFGYGSYMYKWWVQPSMAHNMVVVDGKMQEPQETNPLLFHTGKMMQAMAVETNARWSNPPYFGGYAQIDKVKAGDAPFVTVPKQHPNVAEVTAYSEAILQRRLMIVTDDYVVLADYLKADKPHTFDNLLHLRGAKADASLTFINQDAQFDNNPLSSGQFITNVNNYAVNGIGKVRSTLKVESGQSWESGGFNGYQESGILNIDAYCLWPQKSTLRLGHYAEAYNINKKIAYQVVADNKVLAMDTLGTWILGRGEIDVSVKNTKILQLKIKKLKTAKQNTLFWAGAKIINSKGKEIPLSQLKVTTTNVIPTISPSQDYKGGNITIAGKLFSEALAAEPENVNEESIIRIDLTGLNAIRFVASIGGDSPVGEDDQVRKTVSFRTQGKEISYLTLLEPYEKESVLKKIEALNGNHFKVTLKDGREQEIMIENLFENGKVNVKIVEMEKGKILRTEATK